MQDETSSDQKDISYKESDDDGGFLSDEVDEKRSFTPQPRGVSQNKIVQNTPKD